MRTPHKLALAALAGAALGATSSTTLRTGEPSLHKAPYVQQGTAGSGKIIRHKSANTGTFSARRTTRSVAISTPSVFLREICRLMRP
jgi:hypothetical protein